MYGLKPVPFKEGTLLFLELWSTGSAVISVHQRGMEIRVDRWAAPIFFGPWTISNPRKHAAERSPPEPR